jgi:hypothetical protein
MSDVSETRILSLAGVNKRLSFREPRVPSVAHGQQSSSEAYQILQAQWLELNRSPELVQLSRDGGVKEVVAGDDRHRRLLVPSRARSRDRNPTPSRSGMRKSRMIASGWLFSWPTALSTACGKASTRFPRDGSHTKVVIAQRAVEPLAVKPSRVSRRRSSALLRKTRPGNYFC